MKKIYTLVFLFLSFLAHAQTVDPTFTASVTSRVQPQGALLLDNGSYLVWGTFHQVNGQPKYGIVKFNVDGTIDNTFSSGAGTAGAVYSAVAQSDGKILVAGRFTSYNGTAVNNVMRLNANGTIDATFQTALTFHSGNIDIRLALQSDGKIILTAPISMIGTTNVFESMVRLNANGSHDATFNGPDFDGSVPAIAIQSDNKIIAGGIFSNVDGVPKGKIVRLNTNGTVDNTFNTGTGFNSFVTSIEIVSASQIVVGGYFSTFNGSAMQYLVALNGTGGVATYAMNGKPDNVVYDLHKQADGKVVVAGGFWNMNGISKNALCRLNTDGTIDNTLNIGTGANSYLTVVTGNAGNDVLVASDALFTTFNGQSRTQLAIMTTTGTLKAMTEQLSIQTHMRATDIVKYGSDKFLLTHGGQYVNGVASSGFERLNVDGSLDATFHSVVSTIPQVQSVAVDNTNRIVIGGAFTSVNGNSCARIARLDANGNLDMTFRTNIGTGFSNGGVRALAIQPDGKIIAGGVFFSSFNGNTMHNLVRLNADGTFDNTFNTANGFSTTTGTISIETIVIQSDGKILVGGEFSGFAGNSMKSLVRLNTNGSIDGTFNTGTGFSASSGNGTIYTIQVLTDGKILVGGNIEKTNGVTTWNYVRLSSTGARDATFNVPNTNIVEKLEKTGDGNILVLDRSLLSRAFPDGTLDDTFNPIVMTSGWNEDVADFGNQIIAVGVIPMANGITQAGLTKILIPVAPAAPTVLNGSASSPTQVALTWTDNATNENGFKIERSLSSGSGFAQVGKVTTNITTFTDNTASPNTVYYYRVYSFNAGGVSAYSNVKSITTPEAVPNAPTGVQVTVQSPTTLRISWSDQSANEQNFIVRRSTDNLTFTVIATLSANTTSYDDPGLTVGTRYYYRVTARNTAGESTVASGSGIAGMYPMTAGTLTTCDGIFYDPGADLNYGNNLNVTTTLVPSTAGSSISLDFTSFQTVAGFDALSIYDGSDINAPLIGTYSGTTSPGKVIASNTNGTLTLVFTTGSFTPQAGWVARMTCIVRPAKPTNFSVAAFNTNTIRLTWTDNATTETGYALERSVSTSDAFATLATLPINATGYDDNTVDKNITYYYRLRALGTTDHSAYTPIAGIAFGDGGVWTLRTDMNGPARTDAIAFSLSDKGYVGTGMTGSYALDIRVFDPVTNAWTTAAGYGGSIRGEATSFVVNGKGYVGTGEGFDLAKDLWEYNPGTNAWTQKADLPGTARRNAVGFSINGIGYLGTGTDGALKKDFYGYNAATNTWSAIADFPGAARQGAVAFSINGIGYVGTGTGSSGKLKDFYKYDPTTNVWTAIADFPGTARTDAVAFAMGNKGYVGTGDSGNDEKDFYSYDPSTNTWTKIVSFGGSARLAATAFATTDKGFVGTGFDGANRKDFWQFISTTVPSAPATPTGVVVTPVSSTQLTITWTDNATNETGYSLERSVGNENSYSEIASLAANTVTYSNTGLTANTTYYYRVRAINTVIGNSKYSVSANGTTLPLPPAAPTTLTTTVLSHAQIRLNWVDQSANETGFVILRSLFADKDFVEVGTTLANVVTFTNDGLAEATTYYYKVLAQNTGGNSAMTNVAQGTTTIAPVAAPTVLQIAGTLINKVTLTWTDNASNETEFRLERSTDNTTWDEVFTISANTTTYEDAQVEEATTYYYKIKAKSALGESGYSNTVSTLTPKSIPLAPSNLILVYDDETEIMTLQWTDNSFNEEVFVIERSIDNGAFTEIGTSTTATYEDAIAQVRTAQYRVYARNSAGNSGYSNVASQVVTGIEDESFAASVTIRPNPATDVITIELTSSGSEEVQIQMYTTTGTQLKIEKIKKASGPFTKTFRVDELPKGLMMIRILQGNKVAVKKVVLK